MSLAVFSYVFFSVMSLLNGLQLLCS